MISTYSLSRLLLVILLPSLQFFPILLLPAASPEPGLPPAERLALRNSVVPELLVHAATTTALRTRSLAVVTLVLPVALTVGSSS